MIASRRSPLRRCITYNTEPDRFLQSSRSHFPCTKSDCHSLRKPVRSGKEEYYVQAFKLAYRNVGRNKTRSLLSSLAVGIGMALLLLMAAVLEGEMQRRIAKHDPAAKRTSPGQAASYEEGKVSLKWEDLIANPDGLHSRSNPCHRLRLPRPINRQQHLDGQGGIERRTDPGHRTGFGGKPTLP